MGYGKMSILGCMINIDDDQHLPLIPDSILLALHFFSPRLLPKAFSKVNQDQLLPDCRVEPPYFLLNCEG